ncbi:MAG: polyribonucleotide nucleotidyltransferase [Robiginitomaculum sp.]|nr:polyribonucleotide nucleotidyltransferase [Robiginitomaculum sp.]
MFTIHTETIDWEGRPLTLETGRIARQAQGAVLATYGETSVLAAVTYAKEQKPGMDFFPLTVNYTEKYYAAGRIPGGFFKREGRPTEKDTLTSRLIDRPIRPLFKDGFKNEVQVILTVLSHDQENDADILALVAASAALSISGAPFMGPIAGARVGLVGDEYIVNPTYDEMAETDLDLIVAGTKDAVMMVESQAKELSEEDMLGAVMAGHDAMQPVIEMIEKLVKKAGKPMFEFTSPDYSKEKAAAKKLVGKDIEKAYKLKDKVERQDAIHAAKTQAHSELGASEEKPDGISSGTLGAVLKSLEADVLRGSIIKTKKRIDGRKLDEVRAILGETAVLPRTHGSALFTRGETQALVVATLGTSEDEQMIDALTGTTKEHFMLHYNFPPYSVGEARRMGPPGRREIGHGKLAWRALKAVLPSKDDFPYTIRLVSEITESNGSSSMASVCGGSLAMMDAGVPLKRPVSGIAMGLIKEGKDVAILSDILGDEDHLGDMDFKVAGTDVGITSLQMDIKIAGIDEEIMQNALEQAKAGRMHILGEMNKAITGARAEVGQYAPRIETMQVAKDKIRDVIGSGGKVIREIVEVSGARVNIDDEGMIKIASSDAASIAKAMDMIKAIASEPEAGVIYDGTVVKVMDFGAFVNFFGPKDGLVHISQLAAERVNATSDVVKEGDKVKVKVLGFDRGKVRLSMKEVNQETGEDLGSADEA